MILVIDNYDSFTFNLVQYFQQLGQQLRVVRNDEISLLEIEQLCPDYIVISPGPCTPNEAGISLAVIERFAGTIPILGVCLGHQAIAQVYGAKVIKAPEPMHGKLSKINHSGQGLFSNIPNPINVVRYHSLLIDKIPQGFERTAYFDDPQHGELIMAMSNPQLKLYSMQYHPESILTESGLQMLENFLNLGKVVDKK
ncbi:aminodeoxychorismate/anthranilate synthase component II [Paraferrimonas sp. SM1919]|uniref:anthranilate synthase component II n=1 Tax=Paraferrimonas sp. SM1919 TaxID=2662263 RepID=UPI0013D6EB89|nr:aminodeoxychorismate/anthranilate synthase component II [Paraferrimonas sp. SM1919]